MPKKIFVSILALLIGLKWRFNFLFFCCVVKRRKEKNFFKQKKIIFL